MSDHLDYDLPEGVELYQEGPFLRFRFRDETLRNIIRAFTEVTDAEGQPRDDGRIWFWKYDFEHWSRVWGDEWDYVVRLQNAARERMKSGKRGEWAMTRSDLAELLGVSLGTVDRLINNLKPLAEGGRSGFKWSSLRHVVRFYKDGRPENGKTGRRGHVPYTVAVAVEPLPHSKHWGDLARVYQSVGGQMELLLPPSESGRKTPQSEDFSGASETTPEKALTLRTLKSPQHEDFSAADPQKSPQSESFSEPEMHAEAGKRTQSEGFSSHARAGHAAFTATATEQQQHRTETQPESESPPAAVAAAILAELGAGEDVYERLRRLPTGEFQIDDLILLFAREVGPNRPGWSSPDFNRLGFVIRGVTDAATKPRSSWAQTAREWRSRPAPPPPSAPAPAAPGHSRADEEVPRHLRLYRVFRENTFVSDREDYLRHFRAVAVSEDGLVVEGPERLCGSMNERVIPATLAVIRRNPNLKTFPAVIARPRVADPGQ